MDSLFKKTQSSLSDIISLLQQLPDDIYTKPCKYLSNASIGQHTRHIIELFQCLIGGYENGNINYDNRKRDIAIETEKAAAIGCVEALHTQINIKDKPLNIITQSMGREFIIHSNYYRELLYNLEHCIHHQALIKVALLSEDNLLVSENFGVAASTIEYRKQCAQ